METVILVNKYDNYLLSLTKSNDRYKVKMTLDGKPINGLDTTKVDLAFRHFELMKKKMLGLTVNSRLN